MSDEKNLNNEIIEAVEISEDELNETTGGAMTVPENSRIDSAAPKPAPEETPKTPWLTNGLRNNP